MTLEQLEQEGIHPYAAMRPCNQLQNGLFIRKDGVVFSCPGNEYSEYRIAEDVRKKSLKEIWINSRNYALKPKYNNRCVKDGISISEGTIYPLLRRLKNDGYVTTYLEESKEGAPRKYYQLTDEGKKMEKDLKSEWKTFVREVNSFLKGGVGDE